MKKIASLLLCFVFFCAMIPSLNVYAAVTVSKNAPTEFAATSYVKAKDASKGTDTITVEGGNLSYGSGDWSVYELECSKEGYYNLILMTAINGTGPKFQVYVNDEYFSDVKIADGKEWFVYVENEVGKIYLNKGLNELKISSLGTSGCYFRTLVLKPESAEAPVRTSGAYKEMMIPTIIESEDFDCGDSGAKSLDGINQGGKYRKNEKVDIYDNGVGGYYIDLSENESATYTFEVPADGAYTLFTCKNTVGNANIYFDDYKPILLETNKEAYETERFSVYLTEGMHKMTVEATEGSFLVDYIRFSQGGKNPINLADGDVTSETPSKTEAEETIHPVYKTLWVSMNGSDDASGEESAPFKTIERALDEVKKINSDMTGDIVINIASGEYFISETLKINAEHSGKNGYDVIIKGYNKYNPPVVHGGKKVTGWTEYENGIYSAPLEVEHLRGLYIDGQPAVRARSKYMYHMKSIYSNPGSVLNDGLVVDGGNFPKFTNAPDLETVWMCAWITFYTKVTDIVEENGDYILFHQNPMFNFSQSTASINIDMNHAFFLENAMELLDEPGEFYYNREEKRVYYYPYREQNLNNAEVYAPVTEFLMNIEGDKEKAVENITFDNIDFRYGAWNATSIEGFRGSQAGHQQRFITGAMEDYLTPAQITVNYAENINFKNSRFTCMTATAVSMVNGVKNSKVDGCAFWNLGGTAVSIGTFDHHKPELGLVQCDGVTVSNNLIRRVCMEYYGSVPITSYYESNISILHNDIKDVPYSGITAGWGWGTIGANTDWENNNISYNRIEDVNQMHSDGAHIYTLGNMPGSQISYNYLVDNRDSRGGIYNDSGSGNIVLHHNVVEDVSSWWFQGTYHTQNLQAYNNYSERINIGNLEYCDSKTNMKQEELIPNGHVVCPDGNWPKEALEIIENSGLSDGYEYLFDVVTFPDWMVNPQKRIPDAEFKASQREWIQAEDYMLGGDGVGYHKINPKFGEAYRPDEGVDMTTDMHALSMGYLIETVFTDEWWAYKFEVPADGEYVIDARIGQKNWGAKADVYIDNVLVADDVVLEDSVSHAYFVNSRLVETFLTKGKHTLKIVVINGFYFDAFSVAPKGTPLTVEKEDAAYDEGKMVSQDELLMKAAKIGEQDAEIVFDDTRNHWIKKDVSLLTKYDIIEGVGDNLFAPDSELTKEQAVLLVLRALNLTYNSEKEADFVNVAIENGIIDNADGLTEKITREEYSNILANAVICRFGGYDVNLNKMDGLFADSADIDSDYKVAVAGMYEKGLMTGDDNGYFNPKKTLTRAEAARTIKRLVYLR